MSDPKNFFLRYKDGTTLPLEPLELFDAQIDRRRP
jgi:hypothetical protein